MNDKVIEVVQIVLLAAVIAVLMTILQFQSVIIVKQSETIQLLSEQLQK